MTDMNPKILVVEDELAIREGVVELLQVHEFAVDAAGDGVEALRLIQIGGYDLIVLDLMIPPPAGLDVLRTMRKAGDKTSVLVLTARGSEEDVVEGLEAGADDYVTKPFGVKELVARIRGLLRRATPSPQPTLVQRVTIREAVLDLTHARLEYGHEERVELTPREALLLAYLHQNNTRTVPRSELLVQVWGYRDGTIETRTVDVHIQKLRRKLKSIPGGEAWIETARGSGYRLALS